MLNPTGKIVFYGVLSAIILSAIPYGTTEPIFKSLLCVVVCVLAVIRVGSQVSLDRAFRLSQPRIFLPLVGILVLAIIQLVPLPFLQSQTISVDPYETKIFIISFATVIIAGEVLSFYTGTPNSLKALIATVLITAAASALFGMSREWFLDDRLDILNRYFSPDTQGYAQFVNRNHFVLLIEMALGLTVGILLKGRTSNPIKFALLVLTGIFIYTAIAAGSRGGVISCSALIASGVFVHFVTKRGSEGSLSNQEVPERRQLNVWSRALIAAALCVVTIGISIFTIAFVGSDELIGRMERIETEVSENRMNRLGIWRATIQLIQENPVVGVGFGAYATAIPKYVAHGGGWRMEQAHNEYLEILANGGVIALLLFGVFAVVVVRRSFINFGSDDPLIRSSCFGALLGMLGVLIHSTVDFGLHIMVNALILGVLILIATAHLPQQPSISVGRAGGLRKSQIL
jgi:O-antigen ligase